MVGGEGGIGGWGRSSWTEVVGDNGRASLYVGGGVGGGGGGELGGGWRREDEEGPERSSRTPGREGVCPVFA